MQKLTRSGLSPAADGKPSGAIGIGVASGTVVVAM
jgi:hypothetical protein